MSSSSGLVNTFDNFGNALNQTLISNFNGFVENYGLAALTHSSHVIRTPDIDQILWSVGGGLGLDLCTTKYLVCLVMAYPFSLIFRLISTRGTKNLFSFVFGVLFLQWIYGPDWIHSFISIFVNYLICILAPRKYCGQLCMIWAMSYMTFSHLYRM